MTPPGPRTCVPRKTSGWPAASSSGGAGTDSSDARRACSCAIVAAVSFQCGWGKELRGGASQGAGAAERGQAQKIPIDHEVTKIAFVLSGITVTAAGACSAACGAASCGGRSRRRTGRVGAAAEDRKAARPRRAVADRN